MKQFPISTYYLGIANDNSKKMPPKIKLYRFDTFKKPQFIDVLDDKNCFENIAIFKKLRDVANFPQRQEFINEEIAHNYAEQICEISGWEKPGMPKLNEIKKQKVNIAPIFYGLER